MNGEMARQVADLVERHVIEELRKLPDARSELRIFFHGPPLEYLEAALGHIEGGRIKAHALNGEGLDVPILLQVSQLPAGIDSPRVGEPGKCDEAHLMAVRNTPACRQYLVLVPPGLTQNLSITSASTVFGLSASANARNASFEDWWADPFVQEVVELGLTTLRAEVAREEAIRLVGQGAQAAESMEHGQSREQAWRVLARLFSTPPIALANDRDGVLCLATGFPLSSGRLNVSEALSVMSRIADDFSGGFRSSIERLKQDATTHDQAALESFREHLDARCEVITAFARSPAAFYSPCEGDNLCEPPEWWLQLTTEKWLELLQDATSESKDGLSLELVTMVPIVRGGCAVVSTEAVISVRNGEGAPLKVEVRRYHGASRVPQKSWELDVESEVEIADDEIGEHTSYLRYAASAIGYRSASLKLICLDFWAPAVYVSSRTANKLVPTRSAKANREKVAFESSLHLAGPGRHYIDLYVAHGAKIAPVATGRDASDGAIQGRVESISDIQFGLELDLPGDSYMDLQITRPGSRQPELLRLHLSCDDVAPANCGSEFERGIVLNRGEGRHEVYVDRHMRRADLQAWFLEASSCEKSFLPVVLAEDYVATWGPPRFDGQHGHIYSLGKFLHDPRPPIEAFSPPVGFVESRVALAAKIRGEDGNRLVEEVALGELMSRDPQFAELLETYLNEYAAWLAAAPETAAWVDVVLIVSTSRGTKTLDQEPDAILLSPLHPLRLAWHSVAQHALHDAFHRHMPCPAATILDPDSIPDTLPLPIRLADGGILWRPFISVEVDSDYWSVLWNGNRLTSLEDRALVAPFGNDFGINVGGLSSSFSSAQVCRALDDTRDMFAAKSNLGILISGGRGATQACTSGVIDWAKGQWAEGRTPSEALGPRLLHVFDCRPPDAWPEDTTVSNLTEDTSGRVKWYRGRPNGARPDLGIIAQLESSQPTIDTRADEKAPLSFGGLIRHRIRRQLPAGKFLTETRQALVPEGRSVSLPSKLALAISRVENLGESHVAYMFAPNVNAIDDALNEQQAGLVAVSSSAVDPACFLGRWLQGAYLWDYELPSFSRRAGDTNGYYLLSKLREAEREGLGKALARLVAEETLDVEKLQSTLLEVARRGIPTVRGLSSLDSFGTGELGVFVATRLLQDEFREGGRVQSLLPVLSGTEDERELVLVVPVDPFQSYLEDLARALRVDRRDLTLSRPDLLVVGARISEKQTRIKLTPVEVKCRQTGVMSPQESVLALKQSEALAVLLTRVRERGAADGPALWALSFQHLVLSMIAFGMRVYSQRIADGPHSREWSKLHQRLASAVFTSSDAVEIDKTGRLIVVDKSGDSSSHDYDSDGFPESIVIGWHDAAEIVHGNPDKLYRDVQGRVGEWRFLPMAEPQLALPEPAARAPEASVILHLPDTENAQPSSDQSNGRAPAGAPDVAQRSNQFPHVGGFDKGIDITVGETVDSFAPREVTLNLSDTRLNQLNIGVVGDLGTGKTQLLKSLIYQITSSRANNGVRPRVLIFDYKNDYSADDFVSATGAKVAKPFRLPINLFDTRGMPDSATPWLDRFSFFADMLDKIYSGIGPVQRSNLKQAVRRAYEDAATRNTQPNLRDVHREYAAVVGNRPDSPFAIIDDLIDREVFSVENDAGNFADFFDGVVVISLSALGQDDRAKNMVVASMLNMFYEHMLRMTKRPFRGTDPQLRTIDSFLLVDEADNIMRYEFDVLKKILLQGREFGVGVILASQYLKHFKVNATDYREPLLTWFVHKVPNVTPQDLAALGLSTSAAELSGRVKSMPNHQCLFKSAQVEGEVIRGLPFYRVLQEPDMK